MRRCPVCHLALRGNDPGGSVYVPPDNLHGVQPGTYGQMCSECCNEYAAGFAGVVESLVGAQYTSSPVHQPASDGTYGSVPPGLCGVCGRCAREDDAMMALRLWREDLTPEEAARLIPPQDEHACYLACGECRRLYAPAILRRLKQQGLVPESLTTNQMGAPHFV